MAGDDRYYVDPDQTSEGEDDYNGADGPEHEQPESPASVIFMQMMRNAAAEKTEANVREAEPVTLNPPQVYESEAERRRAAKLEAERLKRVKRKQERRRRHTVGVLAGFVRSILVVLISGATIATILSMWTKPEALDMRVRQQIARVNATPISVLAPTLTPIPNIQRRIGIISGHYGKPPDHFQTDFDPGAICPDGLTENEINYAVASQVVVKLRDRGYSVDLLEEFDPRLPDYDADVLVSLHSNDCQDYGEFVSGFLVSQAQARATGGADEKLVNCIALHYGQMTGLDRRFGLTRDMTDYHVFGDIKPSTPGVILELGFMKDDRLLLTDQQELIANAVVTGILCYLDPSTGFLGPTPVPSETPIQPTSTPGIAPIMTSAPTPTPDA
jgi:N-acetylmuramoyl-L-alanine amidase